jgi:hypothetical protein
MNSFRLRRSLATAADLSRPLDEPAKRQSERQRENRARRADEETPAQQRDRDIDRRYIEFLFQKCRRQNVSTYGLRENQGYEHEQCPLLAQLTACGPARISLCLWGSDVITM